MRVALALLLAMTGTAYADDFDRINHGRIVAGLADCQACHTTPGGAPYAGGRIIPTPFGNLAAPNITPDKTSGVGNWSEEDFARSLKSGIGPGGYHLYPAMPYPYFTRMTDRDIADLWTYLRTVEPVAHEVVSNQLPFPFDMRWTMRLWNALFFDPGPYRPRKDKSEEWNRGAYIVEGPGHCGACHTPKNFLGGDETGKALTGGAVQGWFAPDITDAERIGLRTMTREELIDYLKRGHSRSGFATGPMGEVVADSTSTMSDADLDAIANYLKDLPGKPPSAQPQPIDADDQRMRRGAAIYADECAACHGGDGNGVANLFPALARNPLVQSDDPTSVIRVVVHGTRNVATDAAPTAPAMPAFGWKFSDATAADVMTYIRNAWGNAAPAVQAKAVSKARQQSAQDGS